MSPTTFDPTSLDPRFAAAWVALREYYDNDPDEAALTRTMRELLSELTTPQAVVLGPHAEELLEAWHGYQDGTGVDRHWVLDRLDLVLRDWVEKAVPRLGARISVRAADWKGAEWSLIASWDAPRPCPPLEELAHDYLDSEAAPRGGTWIRVDVLAAAGYRVDTGYRLTYSR